MVLDPFLDGLAVKRRGFSHRHMDTSAHLLPSEALAGLNQALVKGLQGLYMETGYYR